ncbi:MAG TPA: O-antigen ligase family protein [Kofleriaceae bacterium]
MRLRDRASGLFGCAALLFAILAVGGVLRWTQAVVAGLVALALIPNVWSRRVLVRVSPLVVVLGIAAGVTAFQLIPLPQGLLDSLNPVGMSLRADGAALFGVDPWQALTLDAPGSLRALAFFLILLGVAALALRMSVTERGRFQVLACVTGSIAVCALVVGVHAVFDASTLYGLYDPEQAAPLVLGPLLNANHLGGLMAVGAVLAIGLVTHGAQPSWMRAGWVVTIIGCGLITVATLSRGATVALGAGAAVTLAVLLGQRFVRAGGSRRRRARVVMTSAPIGIVATCTVLIVILLNAGGVERELSRTSLQEIEQPTSKYAAWKSAVHLIEEAPWLGVGRGGMEPAFTRVHPASGFVTFSHLENEYVQAVVDWGVVGAVMLGLAMLWLAVIAIRRWRDGPFAAAALGASVVVALQSNFDFGIEMLGVAVPLTAIVATLSYRPLREVEARRLAVARGLRILHIVALAVVAILLLSDVTASLDDDHVALAERDDLPVDELREVAERHPLDYYVYARAATTLAKSGDPGAIRMLNHALRLHPTHAGLHRMAGHLLLQTKHYDQAALEYAAALRATKAPQTLLGEIVERFPEDKAAAAIPPDFANLDVVIRTLRELGRPKVATAWLRHVLIANPQDVHACELLYAIALREDDLGAAEEAGRSCVKIVPDRTTRLSLAKVLMRKKSYVEVLRLLEDVELWSGRIEDKISGWFVLCDAHEGMANWDVAKRCIRQLEISGYASPVHRAEINKRLERIEKAKRDAALKLPGAGSTLPVTPIHPILKTTSGSGSGSAGSGT